MKYIKVKYARKEYTNKEGKKVCLGKFIGRCEEYVLFNSKENLSPMVKHISYDKENEVFLVRDEFSAIYPEKTKKAPVKANVYFYLDFNGNPVGLAYTDAFDGLFVPMTRSTEENFHDMWFLGYGEFKRKLGL